MKHPTCLRFIALAFAVAACRNGARPPADAGAAADTVTTQPPVAIDPVPSIEYPPGLDDTAAVATVQLRLFVDEQGRVLPDSTRIAESSGVPALDSAAVAGAPQLRYAPALRNGTPVAAAFVQPVEFRRP